MIGNNNYSNILDDLLDSSKRENTKRYSCFLIMTAILSLCSYFIPIVSVIEIDEIEKLLLILSPSKEEISQSATLSLYNIFFEENISKQFALFQNLHSIVFKVIILLEFFLPFLLLISLFKRNDFSKIVIEISYLLVTSICLISIFFLEHSKFQIGIFSILFCYFSILIDLFLKKK